MEDTTSSTKKLASYPHKDQVPLKKEPSLNEIKKKIIEIFRQIFKQVIPAINVNKDYLISTTNIITSTPIVGYGCQPQYRQFFIDPISNAKIIFKIDYTDTKRHGYKTNLLLESLISEKIKQNDPGIIFTLRGENRIITITWQTVDDLFQSEKKFFAQLKKQKEENNRKRKAEDIENIPPNPTHQQSKSSNKDSNTPQKSSYRQIEQLIYKPKTSTSDQTLSPSHSSILFPNVDLTSLSTDELRKKLATIIVPFSFDQAISSTILNTSLPSFIVNIKEGSAPQSPEGSFQLTPDGAFQSNLPLNEDPSYQTGSYSPRFQFDTESEYSSASEHSFDDGPT